MDPFNVNPDTVMASTDRELWEWYIKPGLKRSQKLDDIQKYGGDVIRPETEAEEKQAVESIKAMFGGGIPVKE